MNRKRILIAVFFAKIVLIYGQSGMTFLRTPDSAFQTLTGYSFPPPLCYG